MKHTLLRLFCIGLAFLPISVNAQDPHQTVNPTQLDVNIPSPNAATFNKFGNIPVSYYTGIPNISIPIYTVEVGKHSLPISVSYHAEGIKNNDLSSDVGLEWNLNAAYTITRTIRGKPDEHGYVGANDSSRVAWTATSSNASNIDTMKASAKNLLDGQPDEFNFNIGSASGKFILSPHDHKFIADEDIKVEYTFNTDGFLFVLTDNAGVKYYFNDYSTTLSQGCGDDPGSFSNPSTWFVSKIIYPDTKDSLVFNYITENITINNHGQSVTYDVGSGQSPLAKNRTCETYAFITEKKISNITFPNGNVAFTYNKPKLEIANSNALTSIEVFDNQNNSFKNFHLGQSYYNSTSTDNTAKRLKLDSVWSTGADGLIADKYLLSYNGEDIPAYQSKAQDIYGFYNGANNSSLIPGNTYVQSDANGMHFYVPGGNRAIDTALCKKGILNKITYPTGGFTQFDYESNDYGAIDSIFTTVTKTAYANCTANVNPNTETTTTNFTINYNQTTQLTTTGNAFNCTGDIRSLTLKDLTTNQVIASTLYGGVTNIGLAAGHTYSLIAVADCSGAEANMLTCAESLGGSLDYKTFSGIVHKYKLAGGVRIRKITDYDPFSQVSNVRNFSYVVPSDPAKSSGTLMFEPRYDYTTHWIFDENAAAYAQSPQQGPSNEVPLFVPIASFVYTSDVNNVSQNNDYIVGYGYVKETIGINGEGGSTIYNYGIFDANLSLNYPFVPVTSYKHRNGLLLNSQSYDAGSNLQKTVNNYYSFIPNGSISAWKAFYLTFMTQTFAPWNSTQEQLQSISYKYVSEKIRLDSTVNTIYSGPQAVAETQYNLYLDATKYYPYQTGTYGSGSEDIKIYTWRSSDFNVTPTTGLTGMSKALRYMQDNHLNNYPVETYTTNNGLVTHASITEYLSNDLGYTQKILPSTIYGLENPTSINNYASVSHTIASNQDVLAKDLRMTAEVSYSNYDINGNAQILIGKGNKLLLMLYGYGNRFPIAKLKNIDSTSLKNYLLANPGIQSTILNPTDDQSLRNAIQQIRSNFPNGFVSGFTYNPLVGITSMTDQNNLATYYNYDSQGRLINIKDKDGNVLKSTTYQYQGAQ
ncbi:hypothetical protein MTO98_09430 [Mucilaginibacter sp. SMC90]|uniref:hypothetical protein n=1 Tax=Mucilaginibacter sp. SMC90 TaxID=2929803 RepID=UPI001FB26483|nr:hypothetical protein [Mucilaginibacter sp. SMC90]UOE51298.1 hypothetical protein MTO98_09430 [Mucilaginibacter sp. SMC90]